MKYLYETHLHTAGVSACAVSGGADYIAGYIDKGYSGIIVTNHFCRGNSGLPKNIPWKEWVNRFCQGYEEAKEEGDKRGLDVFFGWEETFDIDDDYLVYGIDKEWLLEHPEARKWTRGEQYHAVREAGGCVVQAHPFRQRSYNKRIVLSTGCVDGIEAANGGNEDAAFDSLAYRYAKKIGKPMTAGTDIHDASMLYAGETYGVFLEQKIKNISDYVKIILENKIAGLKVESTRFDSFDAGNVVLPVDIRDENDRVTGRSWKEYV